MLLYTNLGKEDQTCKMAGFKLKFMFSKVIKWTTLEYKGIDCCYTFLVRLFSESFHDKIRIFH